MAKTNSLYALCPVCKEVTHYTLANESRGVGGKAVIFYTCDDCDFTVSKSLLEQYSKDKEIQLLRK